MSDDPFHVLGVGPEATIEELAAARRRLALTFHPDHGGDGQRMAQINAAFEAALRARGAMVPPGQGHRPPPVRRRPPRVQHDSPSFTIDVLPVDAFEALLVVASWIGEVLVDDPPYVLEVHLFEPSPCWCRLDLVPDAGASTVTLTVAAVGDDPAPDLDDVRDVWVAHLNNL